MPTRLLDRCPGFGHLPICRWEGMWTPVTVVGPNPLLRWGRCVGRAVVKLLSTGGAGSPVTSSRHTSPGSSRGGTWWYSCPIRSSLPRSSDHDNGLMSASRAYTPARSMPSAWRPPHSSTSLLAPRPTRSVCLTVAAHPSGHWWRHRARSRSTGFPHPGWAAPRDVRHEAPRRACGSSGAPRGGRQAANAVNARDFSWVM